MCRAALYLIFTAVVLNPSLAMGADTELFVIDQTAVRLRVAPAISQFLERNNPLPATKLLYEAMSGERFQAALQSQSRSERTTAQYLATASKDLLEGKLPPESRDDSGEIIQDRELIRTQETRTVLSPFLLLFLCSWSPYEALATISLNRNEFTEYLRSQSPWMDDVLGSSNELIWNAKDLALPISGDVKELGKRETDLLLTKLQEISPPQDQELINQYMLLNEMLRMPSTDARFCVVIRTT